MKNSTRLISSESLTFHSAFRAPFGSQRFDFHLQEAQCVEILHVFLSFET
jgi:hypothetical protein